MENGDCNICLLLNSFVLYASCREKDKNDNLFRKANIRHLCRPSDHVSFDGKAFGILWLAILVFGFLVGNFDNYC